MNFKQMVGLTLLSIGVVLIVFAFQGSEDSRGVGQEITNSPISPTERMPVEGSNSFLVGAIAVVIAGVAIAVYFREK